MEVRELKIQETNANSGSAKSRKVIRFTCFQDVMLLREVVGENPFDGDAKKIWDVIANKVGHYIPGISSRCCRERTMRLLKLFKAADFDALRRSGTEEQYSEKEQLLQEIKELEMEKLEQQERMIQERQQNRQTEKEIVAEIPNATLETMPSRPSSSAEDSIDEYTPRRRKNSNSITKYLTERHVAMMTIKRKQLKLEERKIQLEERKLKLEEERIKFERERWEVEKNQLLQNQKMMMEMFSMFINKSKD